MVYAALTSFSTSILHHLITFSRFFRSLDEAYPDPLHSFNTGYPPP